MSVEAMTWAFQVPLPPCPKSVLVALANRADEDGRCWPGVEDLERRTGWSRRAVQGAVRKLVAYQLLSMSSQHTGTGRQKSNLYILSIGSVPTPIPVGEGAAGAPPRVQQVHGEGAAGAPESSSESSEEQSREQSPQSPPSGGTVVIMDRVTSDFHEFWKVYPRKTGKKAAYRAWHKARDKPPLADILCAIEQAKDSRDWRRGYIPNPSTWLNQGRWSDEEMPDSLAAPPRTLVELIG